MHQDTKVVIGRNVDSPAVTFSTNEAWKLFHAGNIVDPKNSEIGRILALAHAVPDILLAGSVAGKRLMEVAINGNLTPAADGIGFRGFAMGNRGISEHARLFDASSLNSMINVAAVFHIASAVVGQKYMHDINRNLTQIKAEISAVGDFQKEKRRSDIEAFFDYLAEVEPALRAGERSDAVRQKLEDMDVELKSIQKHLYKQFQEAIKNNIVHDELFGTEKLSEDIARKIAVVDLLHRDFVLASKTRLCALQVLWLFPYENVLKQTRAASVRKEIELASEMRKQLKVALTAEIDAMRTKAEPAARRAMDILSSTSPVNSYLARSVRALVKGDPIKAVPILDFQPHESATPRLDRRRTELRQQLNAVSAAQEIKFDEFFKIGNSPDSISISPVAQIRYLIEWENGAPLQIREVLE